MREIFLTSNYLKKQIDLGVDLLLFIFAVALICFSRNQKLVLSKAEQGFISPPENIEYFMVGYKEIASDFFWIRAIQDFDFCDKAAAERVCENNSWLYKILDTTTSLSPYFRTVYVDGALALTIIITDIKGATSLFEKGLIYFPNDWRLAYYAAYHYLYEEKNLPRAAELLIVAGKNGAPPWVMTLAGRLYSDSGALDLAKSVLQNMIDTKQEKSLIERLEAKIKVMESAKPSPVPAK